MKVKIEVQLESSHLLSQVALGPIKGTICQEIGTLNTQDAEENAVRLAEQMVREAFRKAYTKFGM